jgi:chromosome segregation ATPase
MDVIRKYRLMNKFKEVLTNERNQFKIDNLKQQLTSNTTLWEQLAESEKREKILKQEIERAQQEIATQEKIIERLKDDIKKEGREKQKLLQYKNTKSKRLDELEAKAREFEVLSSVNLNKILGLLENKEDRINHLSRAEANMNETVQAIHRMNEKEVHSVRRRAQEETRFKIEAMTKLEGLRQELQTMQGSEAPVQSVGFWKEQCQSLFDVCKNLKEDNEKLVEHLGVGHPNQNAISQAENELHPLD